MIDLQTACGLLAAGIARALTVFAAAALFAFSPAHAAPDIDTKPAKELFGGVDRPAKMSPKVYGGYTRGCIAGAVELPLDGPNHQAMRPSRNRNWAHPETVDAVLRIAKKVREEAGLPGILVGDLAQPRGGPMLTGHASHQIGLDADIWLMPAPDRTLSAREREEISARTMLTDPNVDNPKDLKVNPDIWGKAQVAMLKAAATDSRVARIFVNPAIKKALCNSVKGERGWLAKVRPWYGHHYHFHIRLKCPRGSPDCKDQGAVGKDDGCDSSLAYWFTEKPYKKRKGPVRLAPPLRISALPNACRGVLQAE